jgi:hypothetical protein
MMRRCLPRFRLLLLLTVLLLAPLPLRAQEENSAWVELHRLRFVNRRDGAVQVSTNGGAAWTLLGRVTIPATTVAEGYLAANYADPGTVAAAAVHGLRIRTGAPDRNLHAPLLLSINPREYAGPVNAGFGGHVAGAAGIFTDIAAGHSIFRELAPLVGNPVFLESDSGRLVPLPTDFQPRAQGETLVIVVRRPRNPPSEIVFENRAGGAVEAHWPDGTKRQLTRVVQAVRGVGRFDGTAYTGVGRLNTAHTGVITVSTAPIDAAVPEGVGRERRGGFQISPAWHNARTEEAGAAMVLIVGTPGERKRDLEGQPPLFRDAIPLDESLVEVSVDEGAWEPMPTALGARLDAFTGPGLTRLWRDQGKKRTAARGVTAFRLRLPSLSPERSRGAAEAAGGALRASRRALAHAGQLPLVRGQVEINTRPTDVSRVAFVRFSVEGVPRGFTNRPPFALTWDTTRVPDGEYLVEAEALDSAGTVISTTRRRVYVEN